MTVNVAPATRQDFLDFLGAVPPYRCIAWCGRDDDRILAIGGVMILPRGAGAYAFMDALPEARRFHKSLHQTGLRFLAHVRQLNLGPIVATAWADVPRADVWLTRLGFKEHGSGKTRIFVYGDSADQPDG